jgi:hypothetical protein
MDNYNYNVNGPDDQQQDNNKQSNNSQGNSYNQSNGNQNYNQNRQNNGFNNNNGNNGNYPNSNYPYNNFNGNYRQPATPRDSLAIVSLILGIASILSCFIFYISIPLAVVSVVLAILSRNRHGRFEGCAVGGLCTAIAGICASLLIVIMMIYVLRDPEMSKIIQDIYNTKR